MNLYKRLWDDAGYGSRWVKIMATKASEERKQVACNRVWQRMLSRLISG